MRYHLLGLGVASLAACQPIPQLNPVFSTTLGFPTPETEGVEELAGTFTSIVPSSKWDGTAMVLEHERVVEIILEEATSESEAILTIDERTVRLTLDEVEGGFFGTSDGDTYGLYIMTASENTIAATGLLDILSADDVARETFAVVVAQITNPADLNGSATYAGAAYLDVGFPDGTIGFLSGELSLSADFERQMVGGVIDILEDSRLDQDSNLISSADASFEIRFDAAEISSSAFSGGIDLNAADLGMDEFHGGAYGGVFAGHGGNAVTGTLAGSGTGVDGEITFVGGFSGDAQ